MNGGLEGVENGFGGGLEGWGGEWGVGGISPKKILPIEVP